MTDTTPQPERDRASRYAQSLADIAVAWCATEDDLAASEAAVQELFATYAPGGLGRKEQPRGEHA
jgi:hypothetical protein